MALAKLSRGLSFLGIVVQSHLKAAVRVLSLLGIVVQGLQKAPLVWTLTILGVVVQTFGVGIYREDFWGLWSIISPQSSSPRLQRDLKALPMDEWSRQCPTMARLQPTALGNDRARTGTTRGGGKDRDWLTAPRFDEDFRVSLAGRRGLRRTAGKSRCVVWSSREAGGEVSKD